jgi:hypothetical protein
MNLKKLSIAVMFMVFMLPLFVRAQNFNYEIKGELKGLQNDTLELSVMNDDA